MAATKGHRQGYVVKKEFLPLNVGQGEGSDDKGSSLRVMEKAPPLPSPVLHGTWVNCQP